MRNDSAYNLATCGCWIVVLAFNIFVGSWSVNYLLLFFLDKTIPWIGAALIGLIAGEISVPVAIVVALLRAFHVL